MTHPETKFQVSVWVSGHRPWRFKIGRGWSSGRDEKTLLVFRTVFYSILTPVSLTTLPHLSSSETMS